MKRILCLGLLLLANPAWGQDTVTNKAKFEWTQDGDSLATIQTWFFQLELDNITQSKALVVTCEGAISPFTCIAPLPSITTTKHTARIRVKGIDGEGKLVTTLWSNKVTFTVTAETNIIHILPPKDLKVIE